MAWTCTGSSNSELVSNLAKHGILKTPRVIEAFHRVDRKHYAPSDPYVDSPQRIGFGATISAPHMHAHAIENLEPFLQPGAHVLDVGSGSGYLLAIFHQLVSPGGGTVLGIDHLPAIVSQANANLSNDPSVAEFVVRRDDDRDEGPPPLLPLRPGTVSNIVADGRRGSPVAIAPARGYSAIHVGAASATRPDRLIEQLASPGRLFVPIGPDWGVQHVWQIDKDRHGNVDETKLFGVNYIPLTNAEDQYSE